MKTRRTRHLAAISLAAALGIAAASALVISSNPEPWSGQSRSIA